MPPAPEAPGPPPPLSPPLARQARHRRSSSHIPQERSPVHIHTGRLPREPLTCRSLLLRDASSYERQIKPLHPPKSADCNLPGFSVLYCYLGGLMNKMRIADIYSSRRYLSSRRGVHHD